MDKGCCTTESDSGDESDAADNVGWDSEVGGEMK